MSISDEFWNEEGTADKIWDRWIVQKKYKKLLLYTQQVNDTGGYSVNSYESLEEALLLDNEIMIFKQFWNYILSTRVQRFWKIYNYYLKSKINEPKDVEYFHTVSKKLVLEDDKKYPAYQDRNLNTISTWYDAQWHIDKYIESMQKINATEEIERAKILKESVYNLKKPRAKKTTDKRKMTETLFWELIEQSREETASDSEFLDVLKDKLEAMSAVEIKKFQKILLEQTNELEHWDIWALAYIIRKGCGDDAFDYFKAWVISNGKDIFESVKNMQIDKFKNLFEEDPQFEEFMYVAQEAYTNKKYEDMPIPRIKSQEIQGKKWDEESICESYSKLCEMFV